MEKFKEKIIMLAIAVWLIFPLQPANAYYSAKYVGGEHFETYSGSFAQLSLTIDFIEGWSPEANARYDAHAVAEYEFKFISGPNFPNKWTNKNFDFSLTLDSTALPLSWSIKAIEYFGPSSEYFQVADITQLAGDPSTFVERVQVWDGGITYGGGNRMNEGKWFISEVPEPRMIWCWFLALAGTLASKLWSRPERLLSGSFRG